MMLSQLRNYDYILEDPLVDSWLRGVGNRLAAASDDPKQDFTFFKMDDRQVNAFATVGGYIGVNAGLVLVADTEDEVAGVLRSEEHTSELQSLMRISYAVFCLKKKNNKQPQK